jgi:hypothetical protein
MVTEASPSGAKREVVRLDVVALGTQRIVVIDKGAEAEKPLHQRALRLVGWNPLLGLARDNGIELSAEDFLFNDPPVATLNSKGNSTLVVVQPSSVATSAVPPSFAVGSGSATSAREDAERIFGVRRDDDEEPEGELIEEPDLWPDEEYSQGRSSE